MVGTEDRRSSQGARSLERVARLPAEAAAPARARRMVTAAMREWDLDDALIDDAALIVSELATNAVRHTRCEFTLSARLEGSLLSLAVVENMPLPARAEHGLPAERMHGLGVVDAVATAWGTERTLAGKLVWARLSAAGHTAEP